MRKSRGLDVGGGEIGVCRGDEVDTGGEVCRTGGRSSKIGGVLLVYGGGDTAALGGPVSDSVASAGLGKEGSEGVVLWSSITLFDPFIM